MEFSIQFSRVLRSLRGEWLGESYKSPPAMLRNGWPELGLVIDRASIVPIYRQIAERLPPERRLASMLAVNRSAVAHAYRAYRDLFVALEPGKADRRAGVPYWITLPPRRIGQDPAKLGELAAVQPGDRIAFLHDHNVRIARAVVAR